MMENLEKSPFSVDSHLEKWMREIRRHIHANPELSFQEEKTATFIQEKLSELGIESRGQVAKTGVVATIKGRTGSNRVVGLRADMDALPVIEETGLSFASRNEGIMHACGHDGHVAMLLGAAALLSRMELNGEVRLLFQPAEEHGNGAVHMIEEDVLQNVGAIFSGHVDTHYPAGSLTIDDGIICAWADPFQVRLLGRSGHAARPHEAVDSVVAAANLVLSLQTLVSRGVDPNRSAVVTIGSMQAGTAQNIIAQEALLMGTVRSTHAQTRENTLEGLKRVVDAIAKLHGVIASHDFHNSIPAVINTQELVNISRKAAGAIDGVEKVMSQGAPSLGAEDFAFYQQKVPGCMIRFGASLSNGAGVSHSRTFDFDENVLPVGAAWYASVAVHWLEEEAMSMEKI